MPTLGPKWSDEARASAKELFDTDMSATEAAAEFSKRFKPITRNTMCGLWGRMGLKRNRRARTRSNIIKTRREASHSLTQQIQKTAGMTRIPMDVHERQFAPISLSEPIAAKLEGSGPGKCGCNIFSFRNESCRWPIGEPGTPEFFFCGIPQANMNAGIPYCPQHERESQA